MTKLIVNADDMGLCEAVNYGIISAYQKGIVTSCTIMAGMPGFTHAVKLLKENTGLGCGVHMTLSMHKPVKEGYRTIVDNKGYFYRRITNEIIDTFDLEEVFEEFCAQIDKVMASGIQVTHLDSHHHVHALKALVPVIRRILHKYELPIRGGFEEDLGYEKTIPLIDSFYGEEVEETYFERKIKDIKQYDCVDLMCHPAFIESYLVSSTSYALQRMKEYDLLISPQTKRLLDRENILLTNYRQ